MRERHEARRGETHLDLRRPVVAAVPPLGLAVDGARLAPLAVPLDPDVALARRWRHGVSGRAGEVEVGEGEECQVVIGGERSDRS